MARRLGVGCLCLLAWAACSAGAARAEPLAEPHAALPEELTLDGAIWYALQNNPELAALREQHGIAAAAVVIAQTYPFNPIWEAKIRNASGPESAGIANRVSNEHKVLIDLEVCGQGRYRRMEAGAGLSRVDWEITFQETVLAIRVVRAFDAALYRQEKLALIEETVRLNENSAEEVRKLVEQAAKLRPVDAIVARTEVNDARSLRAPGRTALVAARSELHRALGTVESKFRLLGALQRPSPALDEAALMELAVAKRADLRAREAAVSEADARVRLARANRFGNPNVGPAYEYDPTRISLIGAQFSLPLPVFNRHSGEIMQREAERSRAILDVRQIEEAIRQDVRAALARMEAARAQVEFFLKNLPDLKDAMQSIERLFGAGEPGVDIVRLIDIRRKLLRAQDGHLDALLELRQAQTDLAAAVGDPALAVGAKGQESEPLPAPRPAEQPKP
ncbi:hypothetical protein AYO44_18635 [Planctomycetaceae bacterium SCGC AG-212-F19]|nr:hypothetical protein AYO44_18635 [Planctomycetaceae bacterium SCGC AG-212-F19]